MLIYVNFFICVYIFTGSKGLLEEASLGEGCNYDPHRTTKAIGSPTVPFSVVSMIMQYKN